MRGGLIMEEYADKKLVTHFSKIVRKQLNAEGRKAFARALLLENVRGQGLGQKCFLQFGGISDGFSGIQDKLASLDMAAWRIAQLLKELNERPEGQTP